MAYDDIVWGDVDDDFSTPFVSSVDGEVAPEEEKKKKDKMGWFDAAIEVPMAIPRGIGGAIESIGELGNIFGLEYDIPENLGMGHSKTMGGSLVEGITEFATMFIPGSGWVKGGDTVVTWGARGAKAAQALKGAETTGKGVKLLGGLQRAAAKTGAKGWAARRTQEALAGAGADFLTLQAHEARLSDLIEKSPALQNPITDFLKSDEDDMHIVGRLKAAVEGLGAGLVFDGLLLGLKSLRRGRKAFEDGVVAGKTNDQAAKNAVDAMDAEHTAGREGTRPDDPAGQLDETVEPPKTLADEFPDLVEADYRTLQAEAKERGIRANQRGSKLREELANARREEGMTDVERVIKRQEEIDVEGVFDVEANRLNLRGVGGDSKKVSRALEDVLEEPIEREMVARGKTADNEIIVDNLEDLAGSWDMGADQLLRSMQRHGDSIREVNKKILKFKYMTTAFIEDRVKPALEAVRAAKADPNKGVPDELMVRAEHELGMAAELVSEMRGMRDGQSQGLRIFKDSETFFAMVKDPEVAESMRLGREEFLDEMGGRARILERIEVIQAVLNESGTGAMLTALKKQRGNKWLLMYNEGFINSILSGGKTLTTNFLGPMAVSLYRPLENALGGVMTADAKVIRQSMREFTGLLTGFNDAWKMSKLALSKNELVLDPMARQVDLPSNQRHAISAAGAGVSPESGLGRMFDKVGKVLGMPTRFLGSTDEFVKQLNYRTVVRADLFEQGIEKGYSGAKLADFVAKEMDDMVIDGAALTSRNLDRAATELGHSGLDKVNWIAAKLKNGDLQDRAALATRALDVAREVTFTRPLQESQSGFRSLSRKGQEAVNAHPSMRPFIPFIRTPVNLLSYAGERMVDPFLSTARMLNPVARKTPKELKLITRNRSRFTADLASGDPMRQGEAYGRMMTGIGFTATGLTFAASGRITGGGPKDFKQRKLLEEAGWRPYSIQLGDNYLSYQRMDPYASMLGIFADMSDINRYAPPEMQEEVSALGINTAIAVARNVGSKTYLQGVMDLAGLMENPERFIGQTGRKFAAASIPYSGLMGQSVYAVGGDDTMREVRTWVDAMQAKIPFLSAGLDAQRNFMGETSDRYMAAGGRWTDWFLPIVHSTTSSDSINLEIAGLGHRFTPPTSVRYGTDMREMVSDSGQSAYDRWMELHQEVRIGGRSLNQAMSRLIKSSRYTRMSPEGFGDEGSPRVKAINSLLQDYRMKAERQLFREFPDLVNHRKNKMISRRALRTGQSPESIRATLFPL